MVRETDRAHSAKRAATQHTLFMPPTLSRAAQESAVTAGSGRDAIRAETASANCAASDVALDSVQPAIEVAARFDHESGGIGR